MFPGAQVSQVSASRPRTGGIPAQRGPSTLEVVGALEAEQTVEPAPARASDRLRGPLAAVLLYAALRAVALLTLAAYAAADHRHLTLWQLLTRYDAIWYAGIAEHGYDPAIPLAAHGGLATTNLAFFPLYPWLIAFVKLLPVSGLTAGLVVAWSAGLAAAWGLYALGTHLRDRRTGILLAGLWAVLPHGLVESMGYSETLFTALAAWSLLAVLRRQWLTAAALCLGAGLTRPTAAALVAAVSLAALVAVCRRPGEWRAWCAMVLAPLGMLGFMAWVGARLGRPDGYFYVQDKAWKMGFDGGRYTVRTLGTLMTTPLPLAFAVTTAVVVGGVLLFLVGVGERLPWPLLVYAGAAVLLVIGGDDYYAAKARLLIPVFPLLLPVAYAMARSRNRAVPYVVLAGLTAMSACYGVYLCLIWHYSP
jgi:hypothetical protein